MAELSANHGGDIEIAKETIRAAKRCGADAIKLQTYTADTITLDAKTDDFLIKGGTIWDGMYLHDLYQEAHMPWEWHEELFKTAKEENILCFSSPFDFTAVDLLEKFDVPAYKIASFEITDVPLIDYCARKGKPMIISTGVASEEDIQTAVDTCRNAGNNDITLLLCTSAYPAKIEEANLIMIKDLKERFAVKSGLSDHTLGTLVPILSVAFGAQMIEKHFILDKKIGGHDASFSLDEKEFSDMVSAVRLAESSIGNVDYRVTPEKEIRRRSVRSIYVSQDVKRGEIITLKNVKSVRPGFGLSPKKLNDVLGKAFNADYVKGTALKEDMIS
ncbi:MAG: pseudaminic acid synthase [Crocinitomicaceae bacterium]|nr:pseudaminic acid synthase [Crocinitomicaceae bacterium]